MPRHGRLRPRESWSPTQPRPPAKRCRTLLIIDNAPLQAAAWTELVRARRRLEKASLDLHRHEEADEPAFRAWLGLTFPTLLSAVRELAQQLAAKARLVEAVEQEAFFTGRPAHRIWHEWQRNGGNPPGSPGRRRPIEDDDPSANGGGGQTDEPFPDPEEIFDEYINRLFGREGIDSDDPQARAFREFAQDMLGVGAAPGSTGAPSADAREIYRRLVRRLHPDAGGAWTPARARAWEQVQQAWQASDADWLARLEAEWEACADLLGPTSAVGRLRAALAEIDAARRDAERRVRTYRKEHAWRFSLRTPSSALHRQLEEELRYDQEALRGQLEEVEAIMRNWERRPASRSKRSRAKTSQREFGF